jgi:hypothetical protein
MATVSTLPEMLPWWPADIADVLAELVSYDSQSLDVVLEEHNVDPDVRHVIRSFRDQVIAVKNSADREVPLTSPEAVANALGVTLSPPPKRWITYPLDNSRRRIALPHKVTGSRFVCVITAKVPTLEELPELPEGGVYLLVRRDSPQVLNIPGVVERLANLARVAPLCDVILYERSEEINVASTVYSLRRGQGGRGKTVVPLDIEPLVEEKVRKLWN